MHGFVWFFFLLFFHRKKQDRETLLEFSLALFNLLEKMKGQSTHGMRNAKILQQEQFVEHGSDCALRRELKQFVANPLLCCWTFTAKLCDGNVREYLGWGAHGRSQSIPSAYGIQYGVVVSE